MFRTAERLTAFRKKFISCKEADIMFRKDGFFSKIICVYLYNVCRFKKCISSITIIKISIPKIGRNASIGTSQHTNTENFITEKNDNILKFIFLIVKI